LPICKEWERISKQRLQQLFDNELNNQLNPAYEIRKLFRKNIWNRCVWNYVFFHLFHLVFGDVVVGLESR
jgi:hypothetical protein